MSPIILGTRKSELAMVQTEMVLNALKEFHPELEFEILGIITTGDKILDQALSKIGSKSLFTKELEVALQEAQVDLVVHSLKDLPTTLPEGMALGAVLEREDPRDAVVMSEKFKDFTLESLPKGSVVGTSSVRRSAQLKRRFPHLSFQDVRGNLNTRLRKLDQQDSQYSALLLAYAGLHRLGWNDRISQILSRDVLLHAVSQGAIGIECRLADERILKVLEPLVHFDTLLCVTAEREFMKSLEGGCSVPLGVSTEYSVIDDCASLTLHGSVTSLEGQTHIQEFLKKTWSTSIEKSAKLLIAQQLGEELANLMIDKGAREILSSIREH